MTLLGWDRSVFLGAFFYEVFPTKTDLKYFLWGRDRETCNMKSLSLPFSGRGHVKFITKEHGLSFCIQGSGAWPCAGLSLLKV